MKMIRRATKDDVARIVEVARAAYIKYVPRMGREPPPMLADFAAEVAAGRVVVIEIARAVGGYLISWPKMEAYFIDNIAVDPAHQGLGLGRQLGSLRLTRRRYWKSCGEGNGDPSWSRQSAAQHGSSEAGATGRRPLRREPAYSRTPVGGGDVATLET